MLRARGAAWREVDVTRLDPRASRELFLRAGYWQAPLICAGDRVVVGRDERAIAALLDDLAAGRAPRGAADV